MNTNVIILLVIHIIGAICSIIFCIKTGVFKSAKENGDEIRISRPSDIMFLCIVLWEILLLIGILLIIDALINNIDW